MFTEEELERELRSFINPKLKNQDLVKRIHMMFGGEFTEKTSNYYNHVKFSFNGNLMLFVYEHFDLDLSKEDISKLCQEVEIICSLKSI